jgi:hypothetical protein
MSGNDGMGGGNGGGMGPGSPGGPRHLLVRANSLRLPIKNKSIHACVTSPPYFGLRSYSVSPICWPRTSYSLMPGLPFGIDVLPMTCCLGNEDTIEQYIGHLMLVMDELWRVCMDDSVTFVNLGDGYARHGGEGSHGPNAQVGNTKSLQQRRCLTPPNGLKPLDLLGIPWRFAFAAQARGWLLRAAPPWIKPGSAMPESCNSRPNVAHEMIFMLTKTSSYYFDMQAVLRKGSSDSHGGGVTNKSAYVGNGHAGLQNTRPAGESGRHYRTSDTFLDSLDSAIAYHAGRLADLEAARAKGGLLGAEGGDGPGAFLVNPQSYAGSHYAAWPTKLVQDMIKCSTSEAGVCGGCGSPYERETEKVVTHVRPPEGGLLAVAAAKGIGLVPDHANHKGAGSLRDGFREGYSRTLGWRPICSCPEGTPRNRACVLDPFGGSGTTAQVATSLGRHAISVDLSRDYHQLASDRVDRPHRPTSRRPRPGRPAATLPGFEDDDTEDA